MTTRDEDSIVRLDMLRPSKKRRVRLDNAVTEDVVLDACLYPALQILALDSLHGRAAAVGQEEVPHEVVLDRLESRFGRVDLLTPRVEDAVAASF